MTGTYGRLGVHVHASWRAVVRASLTRIDKKHHCCPAMREARKCFYRRMLDEHARHQNLIDTFRL